MSDKYGGWFSYVPPKWKEELKYAPEYVIEDTGLERRELERILEVLHEHKII